MSSPGAVPTRSTATDVRPFDDVAARSALGALDGPYLPWGSGAMRPTGMVLVCNDIVLNGRRRVVELGSGLSTVLLARLLGQVGQVDPAGGSRLVTIEHDARWARWVTGQLAREDLDEHVVVIEAALRSFDGAPPWYDRAAVDQGLDTALGDDRIDLLIVDGPPAFARDQGLARYPALPALRARLAAGATVVLDDVERPGEREVLQRWEQELGVQFDRHDVSAGVAVAVVA